MDHAYLGYSNKTHQSVAAGPAHHAASPPCRLSIASSRPPLASCPATFTPPSPLVAYSEPALCRYNWRSAGSLGWPFPKLHYIFRIKYTSQTVERITTYKLLGVHIDSTARQTRQDGPVGVVSGVAVCIGYELLCRANAAVCIVAAAGSAGDFCRASLQFESMTDNVSITTSARH